MTDGMGRGEPDEEKLKGRDSRVKKTLSTASSRPMLQDFLPKWIPISFSNQRALRFSIAIAAIALGLANSPTKAQQIVSPRINEIMAAGQTVLAGEDGAFPDWIEIWNPDSAPRNLTGWHLTDDPAKRSCRVMATSCSSLRQRAEPRRPGKFTRTFACRREAAIWRSVGR
jgi:hypothetical protein